MTGCSSERPELPEMTKPDLLLPDEVEKCRTGYHKNENEL